MNIKRNIINIYRYYNSFIKFKKSKVLTPFVIGNNQIGENSILNEGVIFENSQIKNNSYINRNSIIKNTVIGNYCSISFNCIIGAEEHDVRKISTSPRFENKNKTIKNTTIADDVWIGANVVVKAGVFIGKGSVIGAGSVVTKDIEPFSICVGIPAKVIKSRLDLFTEKGKELLKSTDFNSKESELMAVQELIKKELI